MLYIVRPTYFMCSYVLQPLENDGRIRMIDYEKRHCTLMGKLLRLLRAYWVKRRGWWIRSIFTEPLLDTIACVKPTDSVLFFGMDNLKDLRILEQELLATTKSVFLWNTVGSRYPHRQQLRDFTSFVRITAMDISTFDPLDAQNYHFKQIAQVYRWPDTPSVAKPVLTDIFFVGQDKRRAMELARLVNLFKQAGIKLDINVIRDKDSAFCDTLCNYYIDKLMPYAETMERIMSSRCLLEITQEGQAGLTLRTLEALFMGKKLITNNAYVTEAEFYHPNNILVYDARTTAAAVRAFMQVPVQPIPRYVIDKYDIRTWIKQFK